MWIRTKTTLNFGSALMAANTELEVDDHIGNALIRRGKAERVYKLTEAEMAAMLQPDKVEHVPSET